MNHVHGNGIYIKCQRSSGKDGVVVAPCGIFISKSHPFLEASPDGAVYDPSSPNQPFGFLEINTRVWLLKMHAVILPFVAHSLTQLTKSCWKNSPILCTSAGPDGDWKQTMVWLCALHNKGIGHTMSTVWWALLHSNITPQTRYFLDNCVSPEIVSPVHVLVMPIRNLLEV